MKSTRGESKKIKMFTHRLFNLIVAAVLVVVVTLALQEAFATKAIAPETDNVYSESKEQALREEQLGERSGVLPEQYARNKSYRSPFDECFDVPLREAARCQKASQAPVPSYHFPRDMCFDVPLGRAVTCPIESSTLVPSYRSPLDECFDVSLREVASCRAASQAPIP